MSGVSILEFLEGLISLSMILGMWFVLYGGALLFCVFISILLHSKVAVLTEEELILFIKKYERKGINFYKKIENVYHIPYENIECLDYITSEGLSKYSYKEPSKLCIYTKDRKGSYEVLCAPKMLFYELAKKTNAKIKKTNTMLKYISMYLLVLLFTYICRYVF